MHAAPSMRIGRAIAMIADDVKGGRLSGRSKLNTFAASLDLHHTHLGLAPASQLVST